MTRRILSAWLPGWPIRRLQRDGWPADRPLAAVETLQGQRRIADACPQAQALGVAPGQSLAQARAVCPELTVAEADPIADRAGLDRLALWCTRTTPLAAADPPDGLWLDITGCAHLFGGEQALADRLAARLAPARIAIAGTPGAAWALARAATRPAVQVLPPGQEKITLAPLPVALLRLDPRVIASLRRVGLRSIGELARQPRADITARFGDTPGLRLDQAHGHAAEAIAWPRAPAPWSERLGFVEPIGTPEDLVRTLTLLATTLCARLEAAGLGALKVSAVFHRVDDLRPECAIATAKPLRDPARMARLLGAKLETIDPGFGVEAVVLTAEAVAALAPRQDSMGARTPQSDELIAVLDDLANRLSPDQLWRPAPQASHVPERAAVTAPPLARPAAWPHPPGERPIRLLRPPEPIEATAPVPDDPPILFRWRGALHRVRAASGPERIAAEWWRRSVIDTRFRDYYRVEDQHGARFWLFRTGLPGTAQPPDWYLHGLFG
jgi:protein ImuB